MNALVRIDDSFFYVHTVTCLGSSNYFLLLQHIKLTRNKWIPCTDTFCENRHLHASTHCFQRRNTTLNYQQLFPMSYKKLRKLKNTLPIFLTPRIIIEYQGSTNPVPSNKLSELSSVFFSDFTIENDTGWPLNTKRVSFWSDGSLKKKGSPQVSSSVGVIFPALEATISGKLQAGIVSSARAEVIGVALGLSACPLSSHVTIFCDATAILNIGKRLSNQMTTNQIIRQGLGLEWNLIRFIIEARNLKTKFVWVRGHSNLRRNTEADTLANKAHSYDKVLSTKEFKTKRPTLFQCEKPITGDPQKHIRNLSTFIRKKAFFERIVMPAPMNHFLLNESFETYHAPTKYDQLSKHKFRIKMATDWLAVAAIRFFYIDHASPFCRICRDYSIEDVDHILKHCAISLLPTTLEECNTIPFYGPQLILAKACLNRLRASSYLRQTISGLIPTWLFESTSLFFPTRNERLNFCRILLNLLFDECYLNWKKRSTISLDQEPLHGPVPNFKLQPCCNICWTPRDAVHCICDDKISILHQFFRASRKHVLNKFGFISDSWALFHHLDPPFSLSSNSRGSEFVVQ